MSLKSPQTMRWGRDAAMAAEIESTCAARRMLLSRRRVTMLRMRVSPAESERKRCEAM